MSEIHLLYSPHLNIKYMRAKEREREREKAVEAQFQNVN
jgi:hypothetical protein